MVHGQTIRRIPKKQFPYISFNLLVNEIMKGTKDLKILKLSGYILKPAVESWQSENL